MNVIENL